MARSGAYKGLPGSTKDPFAAEHAAWMVDSDLSGTYRDVVLTLLARRRSFGLTCKELVETPGIPLGLRNSRSASAALTNAYADGDIQRLANVSRERNGVYVLAAYVDGRETRTYRPAKSRYWSEEEIRFCGQALKRFETNPGNEHEATLVSIARKILAEVSP